MFRSVYLIIAIGCCCLSSAVAQETAATCMTSSLYGRVVSSNVNAPLPDSWTVHITAKPIGTARIFDVQDSQGEMYCVKVPLSSKVFLVFERGGYDPQRTDPIDTSVARMRHSFALPIMKLDPIGATQRPASILGTQGLPQDIRAKLNKHKEALSATNSSDIFVWNIESYKNLYRNVPGGLAEIDRFVTELRNQPEFLFLSTSEYENKSSLFGFIIARNQAQPAEQNIRTADLAALIADSRVFSGIRLEAIRTLSSLDSLNSMEGAQVVAALARVLEQDLSIRIRMEAAVALGKSGNKDALGALRRAVEEDESTEVQRAADAATLAITSKPHGEFWAPANIRPYEMYTVVEYPVGKEVKLKLNPVALTKSRGIGTILRDDAGTSVRLELTDVPAAVSTINVYAVDDTGNITLLGPVVLANGTGKFSATTPLSKFMLIAAPDDSLTVYDPNAKIFFRSAVPEGFAVIPHLNPPVGETVAATIPPGTTPITYAVPMLNIPAYKKGNETKLKVNLTGAMTGARANVFIEPHKNGQETEVNMRFHELKEAPTGKVYVLWAVSPDNQFFKLGAIANVKGRNEAEIKATTTLADFGLLVTMEDFGSIKTLVTPVGDRLGAIEIVP